MYNVCCNRSRGTSLQEAWVQSLVGELRSHMPHSAAKKHKAVTQDEGEGLERLDVLLIVGSIRKTASKKHHLGRDPNKVKERVGQIAGARLVSGKGSGKFLRK